MCTNKEALLILFEGYEKIITYEISDTLPEKISKLFRIPLLVAHTIVNDSSIHSLTPIKELLPTLVISPYKRFYCVEHCESDKCYRTDHCCIQCWVHFKIVVPICNNNDCMKQHSEQNQSLHFKHMTEKVTTTFKNSKSVRLAIDRVLQGYEQAVVYRPDDTFVEQVSKCFRIPFYISQAIV